ncbi:MAG: RcnB family protein [Janthinobacterium lividum]
MTVKRYFAPFALLALFSLGIPAFAATDTSVTLDRPGVGSHEIKEGDKAPDEYKRKELALGDWKKRHLAAPGENEQWVEIKDKYVLVNIPNGTIKQMIDKSAVHK